jgi:hypothetical protein
MRPDLRWTLAQAVRMLCLLRFGRTAVADTVIEPRDKIWSRGLTITGIVIAILNMALAWTMMFANSERTAATTEEAAARKTRAASQVMRLDSQPAAKPQAATTIPTKSTTDAADSSATMMAAILGATELTTQSQERRSTVLLGFCFALIAIGFSLFVMGVEGAIGVRGEAKDFGTLLVKTSSPGLFCILLSAILVGMNMLPALSDSRAAPAESKTDVVRAEGSAKSDAIREDAFAKEQVLRAEADAKERVIEAETNAKERLLRVETQARLAGNATPARARDRAVTGSSGASAPK